MLSRPTAPFLCACWLLLIAAGATARVPAPYAELIGRATLPAETFAAGPPSGQFDDRGERLAAPRFASQPVQGISSIKPGPDPDTWWALADNGFGTKWNSPDWQLAIYLLAASPQRSAVTLLRRITLRDPDARFPWRLADEQLAGRPLTGADIDPESLVVMADGSFWISDEFGPWLLHFDAAGRLLERPADLPDPRPGHAGEVLRSPQHPLVLAGQAQAAVAASRGLEGLALAADGRRLLTMLEGSIAGDTPGELRLFEFDLAARRFMMRSWRYRLDPAAQSVGEIARSGDAALLAIERDGRQGDAAAIKRVYRFAEPQADTPDGALLPKTLLADLLQIRDPRHLGGTLENYRFPWLTIEAVQALDARTLLVVNDNNYPATGGRGADVRDLTEWIWLRLRAR